MFALISAGPDQAFQTSCAQARTGAAQGDDIVKFYTLADVNKGLAGTQYHGSPAADTNALNTIPTASISDGQLRLVTSSQSLMRWTSGSSTWTNLTSSINPAAGLKNKLINGNFDLWQRAANTNLTFSVTPGNWIFSADRWRIENGSGSTGSVSATPVSLAGVSGAPVGTRYGIQITPQSSNNGLNFTQPVESVQTLAGQTVTVSLWARMTASGSDTIAVSFRQVFGNSATPPDNTTYAWPSSQTLSTTWTKYTFSANLPAIPSSASINTAMDNLAVQISIAGTTQLQIAQVQLEAGTQATAFDFRPIAQELLMALRYYESNHYAGSGTSEITYNGGNELWQYLPANAVVYTPHQYRVPKRSVASWLTSTNVAYRAGMSQLDVNDTTPGAANTTSSGFTSFYDTTNCPGTKSNAKVTICAFKMTNYGFLEYRTVGSSGTITAAPIWWEVDAEFWN